MKENKYYTPKIEEFCVGFKYEEYNNYRNEWCNLILTEEDLESLGSFMYNFLESFESNFIRVKYLDKEDIENCGFVFQKFLLFKKNNIFISFGHNKYTQINNGKRVLFEGTIKNKSELKKFLQQLGIEKIR